MERIIYCPINGDMDQAEILSIETGLPVTVGKSMSLENVLFDEHSVGVVYIPTRNSCYSQKVVKMNFIQNIQYTNDWANFVKKDYCVIEHLETKEKTTVPPTVLEPHYMNFLHRPQCLGIYSFKIFLQEINVFSDEFECIQ